MTLNCKGNLIDLSSPKIMGILNLTPDSFFDGGKYRHVKNVLFQVEKMLDEGATFIDVGAYSSRPGASNIPETEELSRIVPMIRSIMKEFPKILLSIDTFRSKVAEACLTEGAAMINDISAGKQDSEMFRTIAKHSVPFIMMHMKGNPQTMQQDTSYSNLMVDILLYFSEQIAIARNYGIQDIVIDPGFGFSKTLDQNYELLQKLDLMQAIGLPILVGMSRKSMIYKVLESSATDALNGTTALNMLALQKGAKILRVHDVAQAMECIKLSERLN